jgi:hypothetical protein
MINIIVNMTPVLSNQSKKLGYLITTLQGLSQKVQRYIEWLNHIKQRAIFIRCRSAAAAGHRTALYCTALRCTALHCAALHYAGTRALGRSLAAARSAGKSPWGIRSNFPPGGSQCSTTNPLHCTALHYTALHCTALHCADGTAVIHLNRRITRHNCKEKSIRNTLLPCGQKILATERSSHHNGLVACYVFWSPQGLTPLISRYMRSLLQHRDISNKTGLPALYC